MQRRRGPWDGKAPKMALLVSQDLQFCQVARGEFRPIGPPVLTPPPEQRARGAAPGIALTACSPRSWEAGIIHMMGSVGEWARRRSGTRLALGQCWTGASGSGARTASSCKETLRLGNIAPRVNPIRATAAQDGP